MIRYGRMDNGDWFVDGWTPWKRITVTAPELADAFRRFGDETATSKAALYAPHEEAAQ